MTVAGASCRVVYNLHSGRDPLSDLEIAMNYQQQLEALGAEVTPTATRGLNARLVRNGVETWFLVTSSETVIEQRVVTKQPPKVHAAGAHRHAMSACWAACRPITAASR